MNHGERRLIKAVLALLIVGKVALTNNNFKVNEECSGPYNSTGICTRILDCKFFMKTRDTATKRQYLGDFKKFCRFDGSGLNDQVVCCPSKSRAACKRFRKEKKPPIPNFSVDNILKGENAGLAEFPHFAALRRHNEEGHLDFVCGGVLISNNFVLTAAHCATKTANLTSVRLGKTSLLESPEDPFDEVDVNIKSITIHPRYNITQKYNDIALLELQHAVTFDFNIWPACLADSHIKWSILEDLTIAGFGYTNSKKDGGTISDWLMKAKVQETPYEDCVIFYDERFSDNQRHYLTKGILRSQVCAGNNKTLANTCQGDSGSGLMYHLDEIFYVYGITSFGPSCKSKIPSIYTRVASYIKWIEDIVWPN